MKTAFLVSFLVSLVIAAAIAATAHWPPTFPEHHASEYESLMRDGLGGWNILQADYRAPSLLDGLSLEWDYLSIHDRQDAFTGMVVLVMADPEGRLAGLMPSGLNAGIYGRFADGETVASFVPFGLDYAASADERSAHVSLPDGRFATLTPVHGDGGEPDRLHYAANTGEYAWDLTFRQDWTDFAELKHDTWEIGSDTDALFPHEHWTINMLWPTTRVTGSITRLATGQRSDIDGYGYRENSFGRWAFAGGGWDFAYLVDPHARVQLAFQTYHFATDALDYLDVDFMDNGFPISVQFRKDRGELEWRHTAWQYDEVGRHYAPRDLEIAADNGEYRVSARIDIADRSVPLLSDATWATRLFVIFAQMPVIEGTIERVATGQTIAHFAGQGGGEFSLLRCGRDASSCPLTPRLMSRLFNAE